MQEEVLYPHFCIDVLKIKRALITMYVHATTRTPSWCYIVSYKYVPFERIPIGSDHDVTPLVLCKDDDMLMFHTIRDGLMVNRVLLLLLLSSLFLWDKC